MERPRKGENNQIHNKVLKAKYVDNKCPTKSNYSSNKIMLTDLCPEEKSKIGQLIKTLQARKKQNEDLQEQLNSWKSNYLTLEKVKTELENLIQVKNKECSKITLQLDELNKEKVQKDIELQQLTIQLEKQRKNSQKQCQKVNFGINTNALQTVNAQTQTKDKKRKQKSRQIQVNTIDQFGGQQHRQTRKNYFYQPNSKSFDKIMKGQRLLSSSKKNYETAAFKDQDHEQVQSSQNNKLGSNKNISNINPQSKKLSAEELNDDNYKGGWSQYDQQNQQHQQYRRDSLNINSLRENNEQIQIEDTENDDDQFEQLAKKWLQLKEKNIQQLAQGYFCNEQNSERNNDNNHQNTNLKSLGVQSKVRQNRELVNGSNNEQQIDEVQLNKALRLNDFSASRLLKSKSKRNISQNSDKKSLQNSNASYRNNTKREQLNSKKSSVVIPQGKNPPKNINGNHNSKSRISPNKKGVDFYSADLLDLVEEINK